MLLHCWIFGKKFLTLQSHNFFGNRVVETTIIQRKILVKCSKTLESGAIKIPVTHTEQVAYLSQTGNHWCVFCAVIQREKITDPLRVTSDSAKSDIKKSKLTDWATPVFCEVKFLFLLMKSGGFEKSIDKYNRFSSLKQGKYSKNSVHLHWFLCLWLKCVLLWPSSTAVDTCAASSNWGCADCHLLQVMEWRWVPHRTLFKNCKLSLQT